MTVPFRPSRPSRTSAVRPLALVLALVPALVPALTLALLAGACAPPPASAPAPSGGASLAAEVRSLVDGFGGRVGVYARRLETGEEVAVAADELYPTASMVKVPLLVGLEEAVAEASVLPASVNVAAKPGAVSAARSEVLLVNAPAGDYVLCVMTREQEDTRWSPDNEGERLIRALSAAAWRHWGGDEGSAGRVRR